MTLRICLGLPAHPCATRTRHPSGRCDACRSAWHQLRNARRTQYQGAWKATSRRARRAEPWCHRPGCPNAFTTDLTTDHETGTVECRPCNSSHRRNP